MVYFPSSASVSNSEVSYNKHPYSSMLGAAWCRLVPSAFPRSSLSWVVRRGALSVWGPSMWVIARQVADSLKPRAGGARRPWAARERAVSTRLHVTSDASRPGSQWHWVRSSESPVRLGERRATLATDSLAEDRQCLTH